MVSNDKEIDCSYVENDTLVSIQPSNEDKDIVSIQRKEADCVSGIKYLDVSFISYHILNLHCQE